MRHVVLGTAGHVDHGKTALVLALTGVQTDRLPEEQRRGITIELGFAPWPIADGVLVSIIDAPGHRRLVHTMIAGAAGIDIVLLVVAADEGVMPQTREHVAACKLLGVRRAVVAVNKLDRVDPELAELAAEEALALLAQHGIEATAVPCSAKTGQGLVELKAAVLAAIKASAPRAASSRARLWVDRVFSVHGSGTVVTGTLIEGALETGTVLRIVGPARELPATVRALHVHGEACASVTAPTRLAINLGAGPGHTRISVEDVERGDLVTTDPHVGPSRVLDVWLDTESPIARDSDASLFVGTSRTSARIQPLKTELGEDAQSLAGQGSAAAGGDELIRAGGFARLRLGSPLVASGGDRFVLRGSQIDGPAGAVIGGGVVLDASPPRRVRAAKRAALLAAARATDAEALVLALADEASPRPLMREALRSRLGVPAEKLVISANALAKAGKLARVQDVGWLHEHAMAALKARAEQLVGAHHRAAPLDAGMKLQTLREQLATMAGPEATAELLSRLASGAKAQKPSASGPPQLIVQDDIVRLSTFRGAAQDQQASKSLGAATTLLREAALQGVTENAMARACEGDVKQARALLAHLVRTGAAVKSTDLWFDAGALEALRQRVRAHLAASGKLTIAEFKAMTALGRRQTIPLLELLDRENVTRRQGDDRVAGS